MADINKDSQPTIGNATIAGTSPAPVNTVNNQTIVGAPLAGAQVNVTDKIDTANGAGIGLRPAYVETSSGKQGYDRQASPVTPTPFNQRAKREAQDAWVDIDKTANDLKSAITDGAYRPGNEDVYAMPKEFQKHNTVAGGSFSIGSFMMIVGVIFLILAGSAVAVYYLQPDLFNRITGIQLKQAETPAPVATSAPVALPVEPIATTTEAVATTTAATSTPPKDTFLAYNIGLSKINTFADYYTLINQYGSARRVQQMEAEKLVADASADKGIATVRSVKETTPILDPLAQITETITGETANLAVALTDNSASGTVALLLENGLWKIDNENWIMAEKTGQPVYSSGVDRDQDGLTDKEEDLIGSNKESADSDNDGYSDATELAGLYDPIKKNGKLVDNSHFAVYLADKAVYSILRPSQWQQSLDNTDNSVSFRGADDHFVKIITVENFTKASLEAIYDKKFPGAVINDANRVTNDTWAGITAPDGLSIVIMPKVDKAKYYIIEYHLPADTFVLEYKEVFLAMVKSLVIK